MNFAPVLPAELYPAFDTGRYHMLQAHLIKNNKRILEWCRERITYGHTLILDNGAAELGTADMYSLAIVADKIRPTMVVAPDSFGNRTETFKKFVSTIDLVQSMAPKVIFVPHGQDVDDSIGCFNDMVAHWKWRYNIDQLICGVPKLLDSYEPGGRHRFIKLIAEQWPLKCMHLLGINSNVYEILNIVKDFPDILGIDSTLPCAHGLYNNHRGIDFEKSSLTRSEWLLTETDVEFGQWDAIAWNIKACRDMFNGD